MASIGGQTVIEMEGGNQTPVERVQTLERPGISGQAYRLLGEGGEPYTLLTTTDLASTSVASTYMGYYRNLVGAHVTIVDMHGRTFTNVMVLNVREVSTRPYKTPAGILSGAALLRCEWTLQSNDT